LLTWRRSASFGIRSKGQSNERSSLRVIALTTACFAVGGACVTKDYRCTEAQGRLRGLDVAVQDYRRLEHRMPPSLQVLVDEGYVVPEYATDPWGHPNLLVITGANYDLFSAGPDGQPGTADDIRPGIRVESCPATREFTCGARLS
jgi:hypothetical protein